MDWRQIRTPLFRGGLFLGATNKAKAYLEGGFCPLATAWGQGPAAESTVLGDWTLNEVDGPGGRGADPRSHGGILKSEANLEY